MTIAQAYQLIKVNTGKDVEKVPTSSGKNNEFFVNYKQYTIYFNDMIPYEKGTRKESSFTVSRVFTTPAAEGLKKTLKQTEASIFAGGMKGDNRPQFKVERKIHAKGKWHANIEAAIEFIDTQAKKIKAVKAASAKKVTVKKGAVKKKTV